MKWLRDFLGFTRAQTNGFIILMPLLLLVIFSEPLYRNFFLPPEQPPGIILPHSPTVVLSVQDSTYHTIHPSMPATTGKVDPNEATLTDWLNLHVSHEVAARILAYRKKGGKFFYKSDLLKIYGFDSALYKRVAASIDLPDKPKSFSVAAEPGKLAVTPMDLNLADSAQLVRVFGIGPVLARRIVKYRDALGGFVAWHQLYRVYGLDTAAVTEMQKSFFIDEKFIPRKININSASEQELAAHPAISRFMARAIVSYRLQHGNFNVIEDIRNIVTIKEQDFEAVKPYLTVE